MQQIIFPGYSALGLVLTCTTFRLHNTRTERMERDIQRRPPRRNKTILTDNRARKIQGERQLKSQ